jgi:hypothetical protein
MITAPHKLRAVTAQEDKATPCTLACQATLRGPQEISVRALMPVSGPGHPQIAVRVSSILLLIADRQALRFVEDAVRQAELLADNAYGRSLD